MTRHLLAALLLAALPAAAQAATTTKLADGVYEIQHGDPRDAGASGNSTVVIGARQVLVVDTCFLPSEAKADIAQIRKWTDRPVSFVVNTHFHNDHNLGNRAYLEAFPALTIIAHRETKKDMDRFGPGSASRLERGLTGLRKMLETGKSPGGDTLTADDVKQVKAALASRTAVLKEVAAVKFQSATMTFEHGFTIDLGNREVQVKFLGRANTSGDAVAYLPREKIAIAGDIVVHPIPYFYDGYPSEWIQTLQSLAALDVDVIVPGHGPVLHDKTYLFLMRDLLQSAVDQLEARLVQIGPGMARTLDEVKDAVDLSTFRQRFAGDDQELRETFDQTAGELVKLALREASLR